MIPSLRLARAHLQKKFNQIQRRGIFTVCNGADPISKTMLAENPSVFIHNNVNIIQRYKDKNDYLSMTNSVQNHEMVPKLPIVNSVDIGLVAAEAYVLTDPGTGVLRPFALQWMEIFLAKYPNVRHVVVFACNSAVAIPHKSSNIPAIIQYSQHFPNIPFYGVVHPLKISEHGGKLARTEIDHQGVVTFKSFDILDADFLCAKNGNFYSAKGIDVASML
ncbi:hypothetical protein [Pseudomonas fluorescens]|uniref:hypothetical protein n=1 Tax=Pseudomonas fluorescens TaxID=294 RepID=UPI001CA61431|nr:hypothetical protein [Pseudomonas fluorescens]MBY8934805.1 hypothetical protein [Pseudomonas fluorescens]